MKVKYTNAADSRFGKTAFVGRQMGKFLINSRQAIQVDPIQEIVIERKSNEEEKPAEGDLPNKREETESNVLYTVLKQNFGKKPVLKGFSFHR